MIPTKSGVVVYTVLNTLGKPTPISFTSTAPRSRPNKRDYRHSSAMASLLELPIEVMQQITNLIRPEDLGNFVCTCMKIHCLAKPILECHRRLVKTHSSISTQGTAGEIIELIRLYHDRTAGDYVRRLELWGSVQEFQDRQYTSTEMEILFEAFSLSPLFSYLVEISQEDMVSKELAPTLLLSIFPNLTSISIIGKVPSSIQWVSTTSSALSTLVFGKLRTIEFHNMYMHSLFDLWSLLMMPSIRRLSTSGLVYSMMDAPQIPSQPLMITNLSLEECGVPCRGILHFLRNFNSLEHFSYSYRPSNEVGPFGNSTIPKPYEPNLILDGLLQSRNTLRTLRITAGAFKRFPPVMGSLVEFGALEEIHTQWTCLLGKISSASVHLILPGCTRKLTLEGHPRKYDERLGIDPVAELVEAIVLANEVELPNMKDLALIECLRYSQEYVQNPPEETRKALHNAAARNIAITFQTEPGIKDDEISL